MPKSRRGGRVSAIFTGGFKKAAKRKRDSIGTDEISDDKFMEPAENNNEGEGEEEVQQVEPMEDSQRQEALSSLLTGTSGRRLTHIASPRGIKPKKSILKATSSISGDSGQNQFFTAPPSSKESKLSFSSIKVRSYPVLIGDNPSVTQGVPLTIGWEHQQEESFNLEDYESSHKAEPVSSLADMKFSELERAQIAKNLGYSDNKIHKIAHQVKFSTLTRKKKIIRTLKLDTMKHSVKRGMGRVSESSRKLLGGSKQNVVEDDESDDGRDMDF